MRFAFVLAALLAGCASVRPLAIENVTVIDATGAPARPDMTLIVKGTRIAAVTPAASARVSRNARVIDGRGKFLIPGLWDMHVHLSSWGADALATVVRYGVLTVRDLGSRLPEIDAWRDAIGRGERIGPHIYRAGSFVDGPKEMTPDRESMTIVVHDAEEGREAVRAQKGRGVDLIKTHNGLSREAFLAIADECRKEHMLLASHVPTRWVTAAEASDAGVSSIEHIEMLTESIIWENVPPGGKPNGVMASVEKMTDERAMEDFRRFVKNGTWYDPTLVAYRSFVQEAVDLAAQARVPARRRQPHGDLQPFRAARRTDASRRRPAADGERLRPAARDRRLSGRPSRDRSAR
jgi:imidazolonepropionase-like amidohydrolase